MKISIHFGNVAYFPIGAKIMGPTESRFFCQVTLHLDQKQSCDSCRAKMHSLGFQLRTMAVYCCFQTTYKPCDNTMMMEIDNPLWQQPPLGSWLYLMASSADYKRTKIGMTKHSPMKRFAVLRCGDPCLFLHAAFYLPYSCPLQAIDLEKKLHAAYTPLRIPFHTGGFSEWFNMGFNHAEHECQTFIENQFADHSWPVHTFSSEAYYRGVDIIKAYDNDLISLFGPPPLVDDEGIPW